MMVANSFDLWQKDTFFSAAEEVQESADILESAYRTWVRERREGIRPEDLDELCRELQTALGTAKWQLEEFERAVRLSYGHRCDDNTTARHRQFVAAIESQISRIEAALRECFSEEGKQPLRWVNLDEEECDDFAKFLSGTSQTLQSAKDERVEFRPSVKSSSLENHHERKEASLYLNAACNRNISDKEASYVIEVEEKEIPGTRDDVICQADRTTGTRRMWSSPNFGALKIVIADENEQNSKIMPSVEATPKDKGAKSFFWKLRCGEHPHANGAVILFNQLFGRVGGSQRQFQSPQHLQFSCTIPLTLALMLTTFLIVPFVLYST